ncbi:CheB methylesterase [Novosphingobium sp. PhB165]|uniref:chemotaxis protein CheB n=1 Tax=Novosphingobium sp. PhB165 TaxID=2485105 RepID=UPI0010DA9254|nr:chemotaxis protein CheB [Novosphingobium sp. PhB165]TCM14398.1 CheB methylesterase [Novosphingobium sp. PhB165]
MTADIPIPRTPVPRAVVIGASAGAIQALSEVLPALPPTFPLPILIVVHIPADGGNMLAPLSECPEARVLSLAGIADFLLEVGKGEGA